MVTTDRVQLPTRSRAPLSSIARRIGFACGLVVFVALVVRVGRDGYIDVTGDAISLLDALYYASVTVTTTGYGDITPVSTGGRLATILLITPARILFLILVVSTTVEVLTEQSRELLAERRWRQRVNEHTVICGFGATGQAAATDLVSRGVEADDIVVVDRDPERVEAATASGYVGVVGDATRTETLEEAAISRASSIIVAPNRDDAAVLIILTVRELNPNAHIVAGGREQENLHLLRQGGADEVIDATAAVGRMLGLGTHAPGAGQVLEDLLDAGEGLELVEIDPDMANGVPVTPGGATLVAIIRDGDRMPQALVDRQNIAPNDRIVVLRESSRE
jgi:voltage-gated potassium channel